METRKIIRESLLEIIKTVAPDVDISKIEGDKPLRDQLDIDSMDYLDIIMELRKRYKIEVPKEEYPRLATLQGCVEYLTPKFLSRGYSIK